MFISVTKYEENILPAVNQATDQSKLRVTVLAQEFCQLFVNYNQNSFNHHSLTPRNTPLVLSCRIWSF